MPEQYPQQQYAAPVYPVGAADDGVMARRWEGQDLLDHVYLQLTGQERYVEHGKVEVRRDPRSTPLMNEDGAKRVSAVLKAFINPAYSLSRLADEDARLVFYNCYTAVLDAIVLNADEWGVKSHADLLIIKATLQPIIFAQAMRPVDGWEGNNSKTQILDNRNTNTENAASGWKIPGFGR